MPRPTLSRRSPFLLVVALLAPPRPAVAAESAPPSTSPATPPSGPKRPADWTVYGFSQSNVGPSDDDPQVYRLAPDVNVRAIQKWSIWGTKPSDYNFGAVKRHREKGIVYIGGGTASVIFRRDFPSDAAYDDMSTRDADNRPVPHDEVVKDARRGNIFNPRYRKYLLDWAKLQIDGGVDGLFFDEVNSGFRGGKAHDWNGNEGLDDYALAEFNRWLLAKYPAFTAKDWKSRFQMTGDNLLERDLSPGDLAHNFDYRKFLKAHGWDGSGPAKSPWNPANPLAGEWGRMTDNRLYAGDESFIVSSVRRYWKEMVDELREYARKTAHRELFITSNGLFPYVDFNSVGMYDWNPDEKSFTGRGVDYVPVSGGHLDGGKSLQKAYRTLREENARIAGDVPVVVFIDWPTDMMTGYLKLPLSEKQDYWRIFGAEAYAAGIFPAFHLKDTIGDPTAEQYGMLAFFQAYVPFYREHRALYQGNAYATEPVRVGAKNVSASLLARRGSATRTLHLVNHNYNQGITPQAGFTVQVTLPSCPSGVSLISPDFAGSKVPAASCIQGNVTVTVDQLQYYDVLVFQ